jgi:hypothetical protein
LVEEEGIETLNESGGKEVTCVLGNTEEQKRRVGTEAEKTEAESDLGE